MKNRKFHWLAAVLLSGSFFVPAYAQEPVSRFEQLKKGAKVAGYGLLSAAGAAVAFYAGAATYGHVAWKKNVADKDKFSWKQLSHFSEDFKRSVAHEGDSFEFLNSDTGAMAFGCSVIGAAGIGMLCGGIRGIRGVLNKKTGEQAKKEDGQLSKIKEKIKEGFRETVDAYMRGFRVLGYSVSAIAGAGFLAFVVSSGVRLFRKPEGKIFNWDSYKIKHLKSNVKKNKLGRFTAAGLSPCALGLIALGLHGLKKEYRGYKESKLGKLIDNAIDKAKDATSQVVDNVFGGEKTDKDEQEMPKCVDQTTQTDDVDQATQIDTNVAV